MIKSKSNHLNQFSLAFIAELQQDGISFIDRNRENFVKTEHPHYINAYTREMEMLYKWWRYCPNKLLKYKSGLLERLDKELADRILQDKYFRFMILKAFHDSELSKLSYDCENSILSIIVKYDDCFCKTQFGDQISLTFYNVENCPDCLNEIIDFVNDASVLIMGIEIGADNNMLKFNFDLAYYGSIEGNSWDLQFLCKRLEIE